MIKLFSDLDIGQTHPQCVNVREDGLRSSARQLKGLMSPDDRCLFIEENRSVRLSVRATRAYIALLDRLVLPT
jgi:hypothetical protein